MQEEIFKANRPDPQAHEFVATYHPLQWRQKIYSTLHEESHESVPAFDATDSSQRTNWREIGWSRQPL